MFRTKEKPPPPSSLAQRLEQQRALYRLRRRSPSEDPEIVDDYLAVCVLLERLANARARDGTASKAVETHLQTARACLEQVEYAPTLEEKWSCINKANAALVLACVNRDEQTAVMLRLKNLFPLLRGFKDRLPEPFKDFGPSDDDVMSFDPPWAHQVLETAAQGWHLVNEQNGFSTRFWEKARKYVTVLLIAGIVGTELASAVDGATLPDSWSGLVGMLGLPSTWLGIVGLTYLWAAVFGALGGALSSLLGSRSLFVSATTYRVSRSQAQMRILLGGVGAFVVVLAIESGLVFSEDFRVVLDDFIGLAVVAIAAGFSERLFVTALERIGGTLAESRAAAGAKEAVVAAAAAGAAASALADPDLKLREIDEEDTAKQIDVDDEDAQRADRRLEDRLRELDEQDLAEQLDEADARQQI